MPYSTGPSLQKRIDEQGALPLIEILRIGYQVAAGLAAAHDQGLVHRDIKPANILLNDGVERLVITDFGLARAVDDATITRSGVIAGTPQYMSPEQARGDTIDHRSDLFSLGSVLYTACTGRAPFRGDSAYGILRKITDEPPRQIADLNPELPDWLCTLIERLHAKEVDRRYESATEVASLLQQCMAHVQTPGQPLPAELRSEVTTSSRQIWAVSAAVALCVAFCLIAGRSYSPARDEADTNGAVLSQVGTDETSRTPVRETDGARNTKDLPQACCHVRRHGVERSMETFSGRNPQPCRASER